MELEEYKDKIIEVGLNKLKDSSLTRDIKIVAEGDSWFNYHIQKDVIDFLIEKGYGIDKRRNLAKAGDTLENMVYGMRYKIKHDERTVINYGDESLQETLSMIDRYNPKFVLFSAGGNDVVGEELINYLNHSKSELPILKKEIFFNNVNGPIKLAIEHFIKKVLSIKSDIHILMDGYDYAKPNGKSVARIRGPWILKSMGKKGIVDRAEQNNIIKIMVDIFNEMLNDLSNEYPNFHYINLRNMFPNENQWHNEIHLKSDGYKQVAQKYHDKIVEILGYDPTNN